MVLHAVTQLNHTIIETFSGMQVQRHVAVTPRYQWYAIPDEHWNHTDDKLVNRNLGEPGATSAIRDRRQDARCSRLRWLRCGR
jgi:hypothetical protein